MRGRFDWWALVRWLVIGLCIVLGIWAVIGWGLVVIVLLGLGLAVVGVGCLVWLVLWWL